MIDVVEPQDGTTADAVSITAWSTMRSLLGLPGGKLQPSQKSPPYRRSKYKNVLVGQDLPAATPDELS